MKEFADFILSPAILFIIIKPALMLAVVFLFIALCNKNKIARRQIWHASLAALLLFPVMTMLLPSIPFVRSIEIPATNDFVLDDSSTEKIEHHAASAMNALLILYGMGTLFLLSRLVLSVLHVRRMIHCAAPYAREEECREFMELDGTHQSTRIFISNDASGPFSYGLKRPVIILPAAANDWDAACLKAVLLHEHGHVRAKDPLLQIVARVTCALYWLNPLIWMAHARFVWDRERACDEYVLSHGVSAVSYAEHLLKIAENSIRVREPAAVSVSLLHRRGLEERIMEILNTPKQDERKPNLRVALTTGCFLVMFLAALELRSVSGSNFEKRLPASEGTRVELLCDLSFPMKTFVQGGTVNEAILRVDASEQGRKDSLFLDRIQVDTWEENGTSRFTIQSKGTLDVSPGMHLTLILTVPKRAHVSVKTRNGNLIARNLTSSQLDLNADSGSIEVMNISDSRVDGTTSGGNITVYDSSGQITATTEGGNITLRQGSGEMIATTKGGNVDAGWNASKGKPASIQLSATGGNVLLRIPKDLRATLLAERLIRKEPHWDSPGVDQLSYSFESKIPLQIQQQNESREDGGRNLTTVAILNGGGEMKIHLRTLNGNIEVREN